MLLVNIDETSGWVKTTWNLTYGTNWDQIKKAVFEANKYCENAEYSIDHNEIDISNDIDLLSVAEGTAFTIRGLSAVFGCPISITFSNHTNIVELSIAKTLVEFQDPEYEKINKSLCQYMNGLEIAMYK